MRIRLVLLTGLGFGLLGVLPVHGAEVAPPDSSVDAHDELVVTAAPYAVSERSVTSSVNIINREQLDVAPAVGLGDLLSGLPGIRSTFFGPGASRPVIRGLSGPRVLILQNGVGQIDASDVSPDHAVASDPEEASRIEVLRGPSTLAYGGSGIGGVVNVIDDRVPTAAPKDGLDGRLSSSYSTNGDAANVAGHVLLGKGPLVLSLEGVRRHSDDYKAGGRPLSERLEQANDLVAQDTRTVDNTKVDLEEYGAGLSYVGDWGYLGASVRQTKTTYGVPYPQIEGEPPGGDEGPVEIHLRQTRYDLRGQFNVDWGPFSQVRLNTGYANYKHFEANADTREIGTTFLSKGEEGRLELVQRDNNGWQGAVGLQGLHRNFDAIGDEAFVPPTKTDQYAIFTLQRLDKERWGLEGGFRIERNRVKAEEEGRQTSEPAQENGIDFATAPDRRTFTNYSASGAIFFRPMDGVFLSANVSHNERAPTQYELYADGPHDGTEAYEIGDPTLNKEKVNSVEGIVRYSNNRLNLEGHLYYARYNGFIQETPTGQVEDDLPVQQFQQVDARFYGAEVTAGYDVWRSAGSDAIRLEGTFDYVHGQSDEGPAPRIPPYGLTGRAIYSNDRVTARAEVRYVAKQDRVLAYELPTDDYTLVNLFASYKPLADRDFRVFAAADNLTDAEAREHTSFLKDIAPLPGRNFRLGVAYEF